MAAAEQVTDFAGWLATLPDTERDQALQQAQVIAVANADPDKLLAAPVRTLAQYLAEKIPSPPGLVQCVIPELDEPTAQVARGAITITTSPGGKGKTVLSLTRLLNWALERPVFPDLPSCMSPTQPVRSLIIENEGAAGFFQSRLQRQVDGLGLNDDQRTQLGENVLIWGDGGWSALKLDDEKNMAMIRRAVEDFEPDVLFMEPLRGLHRGDENSNTELAVVLDALNGLASNYDIGVMITHHERKSGAAQGEDEMYAARGGGVITDLTAVVERFKSVKAGTLREVSWTKSRFGPAHAPVRMSFNPVKWSYSLVSLDDSDEAVLQVLEQNPDEYYNVSDVAELTSETEDHSRKVLNRLAGDGRLKKIKNPRQEKGQGGFLYRSNTGGNSTGGMEL